MANLSDDGDWELLYFARLQELRRSRGSRKGYMAKSKNRLIKELMSCHENVELVKNDLVEFNADVAKFREAHLAYHEQLSDELDISESTEYYNSVMLSASDFEREVSSWIVERSRNPRVREEPGPEDSVSNAGSREGSRTSQRSKPGSSSSGSSRLSSASAEKARAAAKKAILEAEAVSLAKFEALQREELSLQMRKKALELQTEIEKAKAEELAYAEAAECAERASLTPCASFVAEKGTIPKIHMLSNQSEDRLKLALQSSEALPVQSKETPTPRLDNFAATK